MLIRRLLSTTALVTVYLLAFPLTAVAQYAGQEEIAFGMSIPGERGGGSLLTLLYPAVGRLRLLVNDGVTWLPEAPVAGQSIALSAVQHAFLATFQLWQDSMNEWSALAAVRSTFMHTDALLPDSKVPFPDELWQARFGTTYRHQFANGWIGGGTLSVGSASDQPFAHFDDLLVGGMAFLRVPQGTHNAWLFSLAYSPTSELPIPLPGVAYAYQPSERLRAVIGLPLALMYRPWDTLMLVGSYMLLRTVYVRATYRLTTLVHLSVGFAWENDSTALTLMLGRWHRYRCRSDGEGRYLSSTAVRDVTFGVRTRRIIRQGQRHGFNVLQGLPDCKNHIAWHSATFDDVRDKLRIISRVYDQDGSHCRCTSSVL